MLSHQRRIQLVAISLLLAIVANGLLFWCRKMGWLDAERWTVFLTANPDWWLRRLSPAENAALADFIQYQYQHDSNTVWLKRLKDLWLVASGFLLLRWVTLLTIRSSLRPQALLALGVLVVSVCYGLTQGSALLVAAGVYSLVFTLIAIAIGSQRNNQALTSALCHTLLALSLLNLVCVALEVSIGQRLFPGNPFGLDLNGRAVGLLSQPASLGATTVLALVWLQTFSSQASLRRWLPMLWVLALLIVIASASAIAVLMWAFAALLCAAHWLRLHPALTMLTAVVAISALLTALLLVPELLGRTYLPRSILVRTDLIVQLLLTDLPGYQLFFGSGWGHGTNAAAIAGIRYNSDTTIAMLLHQFGVIGLLLCYGVIGYCIYIHQQARRWLLVVVLASCTINITELFPVNFLLGIVIGQSLLLRRQSKQPQPNSHQPTASPA